MEVPLIAMHYCFMGKDDKKAITILVVKDQESRAMKAFSVKEKGSSDGEIVRKVLKLIDEQWGRRKIIFKGRQRASDKGTKRSHTSREERRDACGALCDKGLTIE